MRFLRSISRSSAALLADTSLVGPEAASAVRLAWLRARCWRPRAWPPLRAAALRELADREEPERLLCELLRAEEPERLLPRLPPLLPPWVLRRLSAISLPPCWCAYPLRTISCSTRRRRARDQRAEYGPRPRAARAPPAPAARGAPPAPGREPAGGRASAGRWGAPGRSAPRAP